MVPNFIEGFVVSRGKTHFEIIIQGKLRRRICDSSQILEGAYSYSMVV